MDDRARQQALGFWNFQQGQEKIPVWLDCDTGHDDAFAILLCAHNPRLELLGVSTVHGNASLQNTTKNSLSILEAIGRRDIPVYPGAAKPFCREAVHAENIHGDSGLDGTTILPEPVAKAQGSGEGAGVHAMYQALIKTTPGTAWLIATGALTNVGLVFAVYPSLVDHIAGLSIMGGAIGGFFTHAPLGRVQGRLNLSQQLHKKFPARLPDDSGMSIQEVATHFRKLGLITDADDIEVKGFICYWRRRGNHMIYCDPEAAASLFSNPKLAAKTTLIPLDLTHQVLGNDGVMKTLRSGYGSSQAKGSAVRHLFLEILTFFATTYSREFAMNSGPPLHDPIAVAAAFAPALFDDNDGERYDVYVVRDGDDSLLDHSRTKHNIGQCGRTIARLLPKGESGIRIPRALEVGEFWHMIDLALESSEKSSPLAFAE